MEEMLSLVKSLDPSINLICHDNDELYTDSGFVNDTYAGTKLWDIHPHSQFYVDSKIEERILENYESKCLVISVWEPIIFLNPSNFMIK